MSLRNRLIYWGSYALCRDLAPPPAGSFREKARAKKFLKKFSEICVKMSLRNRLIYRGSYALCRDLAPRQGSFRKKAQKKSEKVKNFQQFHDSFCPQLSPRLFDFHLFTQLIDRNIVFKFQNEIIFQKPIDKGCKVCYTKTEKNEEKSLPGHPGRLRTKR